jgi:hypothetical protein
MAKAESPSKPASVAEKTFNVSLTESELTPTITALLQAEHTQTILANAANRNKQPRIEAARKATAAKALSIAHKLTEIGGTP